MSTRQAPDYPYEQPPLLGTPLEVADGVYWLRMPLDLTGLDHINLWVLRDNDGWTLVDTGLNSERIQELWNGVFASLIGDAPVHRVICTHFHPDHMGLAGWLCRRTGAPLWASRREWLFGRMLYLDAQDTPPDWYLEHFRRVGFSEQAMAGLRAHSFNNYRKMVSPVPEQLHRIADGDAIEINGRIWRVISGYGHSPEHSCLYCEELGTMIAGDQVLPRITPHIGVYPSEPDGNPLQEYLDSLDSFTALPADTLVLPAHGLVFRGLPDRLDYLRRHHDERLAALEDFCDEPARVLSMLKVLFNRRLGPFEAFLGVGEALAHLNCLIGQGRIERLSGDDGIWLYRATKSRRSAA